MELGTASVHIRSDQVCIEIDTIGNGQWASPRTNARPLLQASPARGYVPAPEAPMDTHWTTAFLDRLEDRLDIERWPAGADPAEGRPMKVFVDGKLAVRLRVAEDATTVELLTGKAPAPRGCTPRGPGWEATFATGTAPDDDVVGSWLDLLSALGQPKVSDEPEEDDAYHWVWDNRARLTDRNLYDFDRKPFSQQLRRAFDRLTDDEQRLLRAQWQRELMEEGPTVAETLGWSGKQVMDTYRSAMAKLKSAATRYERPRRRRR